MLDYIYHMTLKLLKNGIFGMKTSRFYHLYGRHYVTLRSL